jgi:hypothetical protein
MIVNDKLEWMWKEAVSKMWRYYTRICLNVNEENHDNLAELGDCVARLVLNRLLGRDDWKVAYN